MILGKGETKKIRALNFESPQAPPVESRSSQAGRAGRKEYQARIFLIEQPTT